jgi:hypothetical protein
LDPRREDKTGGSEGSDGACCGVFGDRQGGADVPDPDGSDPAVIGPHCDERELFEHSPWEGTEPVPPGAAGTVEGDEVQD